MVLVAKKRVYDVEIPLLEHTIQVLSSNPGNLVGRVIKMDLTRILKGKNVDASIIIKKENDKFIGDFLYIKLLPSFIRRMIRKSVSYVEDSFVCQGKESKFIIKPYLLTRKVVHRSTRKALRNKAKEVIIELMKNKTNNDVFYSIISGQMQKEIAVNLKKIYPLSLSEIRIAKIKL